MQNFGRRSRRTRAAPHHILFGAGLALAGIAGLTMAAENLPATEIEPAPPAALERVAQRNQEAAALSAQAMRDRSRAATAQREATGS